MRRPICRCCTRTGFNCSRSILNLVQNSIDAIASTGRDDGRIRIAAAVLENPRRVEIAVSDNGAGIAPALAERLFEPLTTSKQDGLGLGLSICATIVQSHHGRLWLQSGAPGATEFRFWLPLQQAHRFMTAVFVIDDQNSVRHALGEMLRVFGFTVEVFDFADRFLQTVVPGRPGCVVADVRMPGMDGIELVRELARRKIALPVVLISGHADVPMAVAGIKAGAEDFIEKPVDDRLLVAAINRGLARTFEQQVAKQSQDALGDSFSRLTPRQVEIFDLVANGFTSQAIASKLDISIRTVESYRAQIMEKMQAESVAVLVRQAIKLGRIAP